MVVDKRGHSDFVVKRGAEVAKKKKGMAQVGFEEISWSAAVEGRGVMSAQSNRGEVKSESAT